jgi:hypothetical protein
LVSFPSLRYSLSADKPVSNPMASKKKTGGNRGETPMVAKRGGKHPKNKN